MVSIQTIMQTQNQKIIQFYRKNVYGKTLEYIKEQSDADAIRGLTQQRTVDSRIRELLRDLTNGYIKFEEVTLPHNS